MAEIGSIPFKRGDEAEGFLIAIAVADKGLIDIHDRRTQVLSREAAREWMQQGVGRKEAKKIVADGSVPTNVFIWRSVGNDHNQGPEFIEPID